MSTLVTLGRTTDSTAIYSSGQSRAELSRISVDLVNMYRGNQITYVLNWLATNIRDPQIRRRYQELAVFSNIVRLLVDHVSTLGQVPVRVVWMNSDTSAPDPRAQKIWEEIVADWMTTPWDAFVQSLSARIELVKTVIVSVEWDEHNEQLALVAHTPAEMDVSNSDKNENVLAPDKFSFLDPASQKRLETWDFSSREPGPSAVRRSYSGDRVGGLPVLDPRTGRSVIPFVPFRTTIDSEFFVWDGQAELANAQEFVNRLYTRLSVLCEMGTNKTLVLSGAWTDSEGNLTPIPMDITKAIKEPDDAPGEQSNRPKIRWDGPAVTEEIKSCLDVVSHWVETTAATFRINASAIRAKNEATSGYALQIESSALKAKHTQSKNAARPQLLRLAKIIQLYWDFYGPENMRLGPSVYPTIVIPDYSSASAVREEVDADIALITAGLKRRLPVIYRYEPGIPPVEAYKLAGGEADEAEDTGETSGVESPELETPDGEDTGDMTQNDSPLTVTPAADVQQQALNGAQMASLQQIVAAVAARQLPAGSALALVKISIPTLTDAMARELIEPATSFTPATVPAEPGTDRLPAGA